MPRRAVMPDAIARFSPGESFCARDFDGVTSPANARNLLARFAGEGLLERLLPGVYCLTAAGVAAFHVDAPGQREPADAPESRNLPGEASRPTDAVIHPSAIDVAHTLARLRGWSIVPAGMSALAELGIVPAPAGDLAFASTGSSLSYDYQGTAIHFVHGRIQELVGPCGTTRLVVQALREVHKVGMSDDAARTIRRVPDMESVVESIARTFSSRQIAELERDAPRLTRWMHEAIGRIARRHEEIVQQARTSADPRKGSDQGKRSRSNRRAASMQPLGGSELDPSLLDPVSASVRSALARPSGQQAQYGPPGISSREYRRLLASTDRDDHRNLLADIDPSDYPRVLSDAMTLRDGASWHSTPGIFGEGERQ